MQRFSIFRLPHAAAFTLAIGLSLALGHAFADASESQTPLGRQTTDRQGDLQQRLLESGLAAIAEQLCQQQLADAKPGSDESATWTIRLSNAMLERGIAQRPIDPQIWTQAADVLDRWLLGYETSSRAPWIRLARAMVDFRRSQVATLSVLASPESSPLRQTALAAIRESEDRLNQLSDSLAETIPLADLGRDKTLAPAAELRVVLSTVQRQLARTLLARADLYPADSDDALAAAADAARQTEALLRKTPTDDASFGDVVRLSAEAWIRVGDTQKATAALRPLLPTNESDNRDPTPSPAAASVWDIVPETGALLIRIALADDRHSEARQWLDAYYPPDNYNKDVPAAPPELDLARLMFLLSGDSPDIQSAADWAEAIDARHGPFYGRTASLRLTDLGQSASEADPRVLAAAAAAMLRQGEFAAAAGQFAEAANREMATDAVEAAFNHRLQAAAAYRKADDLDRASEQLTSAGQALPDHRLAEAAHLQAAFLLVQAGWDGDSPRRRRYQQVLQTQLKQWPQGQQTQRAREMLSQLLESQQAWAEAAQLWTPASGDPARGGRLWRKALRAAGDLSEQAELLKQADAQLSGDERSLLIALWADRPLLLKFKARSNHETPETGDGPLARVATAITNLRLGDTNDFDLQSLPADAGEPWGMDLIKRIGRDAQESAVDRPRLGVVIGAVADRIVSETKSPADQIAVLSALVASGQSTRAIDLLDQFPGPQSGQLRHGLAQLLLASDDTSAKRRGIDLLLQYGRGVQKASEPWFAVQLEICDAYAATGDTEAAKKLANYLLLTSPPTDPQQLAELRRHADPSTETQN